jgi:nicotinamide-nucleotide amidase
LREYFHSKQKLLIEKHYLCLTSESAVDPTLRELKSNYPDLDVGIYPSYGLLTVVFAAHKRATLDAAKQLLHKRFETFLYDTLSGSIEEAVHNWMIVNRKTLALAESCTGGAMAARLTALPGSSDYFLGSAVVYSNAWKHQLLGVDQATLNKHGEVSEATVREMLSGLFLRTDADYGVAVTGFAGPTGGSPDQPIGTVWAAIGQRGHLPDVGKLFVRGNRKTIITVATNRLLAILWRKAAHGVSFLKI